MNQSTLAATKERPILFSAPMVRAILDGRKTQTRRILKSTTEHKGPINTAYIERWKDADGWKHICPYGKIGDRLWVRETWAFHPDYHQSEASAIYRATDPGWDDEDTGIKWKPSIFMPRAASRITLEITGIRVERVQDISEEDAKAEGVSPACRFFGYSTAFSILWDSINGKTHGADWKSNPWVWVVEFKRVMP